MKHKAYTTLAFSEEHTETVDELSVEDIYRPSRSISQFYRLCRSTVLQTEQKHIGKWREAIEVEMNIQQSETYHRPPYRLDYGSHMQKPIPSTIRGSGCENMRTIDDQTFSTQNCGRTARLLENSLRDTLQVVCRNSRKN